MKLVYNSVSVANHRDVAMSICFPESHTNAHSHFAVYTVCKKANQDLLRVKNKEHSVQRAPAAMTITHTLSMP